MRNKGICFFAVAFLLVAVMACASADVAKDITEACTITSPGRTTDSVHDGKYTSFWRNREQKNGYLEFKTPEDEPAYWLYVCFGEMPGSWAIEVETAGEWSLLQTGPRDYYHTVLPLNGAKHFRLIDTTGKKTQFKINEVYVFGEGDLPDWVQQWEPAKEKADLMLIAAHPDDELLFFGGTIPYYAVEREKNVVVVYMSYSNTTRRSELLNGLWSMGIHNYPVIGEFHDTFSGTLEKAYKRWKKEDARAFVADVIRHYKPDVVLTHDTKGEYGHGAHQLCADTVSYCVQHVHEKGFDSASLEKWGPWQVQKLYLHLYPENQIEMNWNEPLKEFGGKTGLELAKEAYKLHATQQTTDFEVTDQGPTSCARFGLAYTIVGTDDKKDDFLEHVGEIQTQQTDTETVAPGEDAQNPQREKPASGRAMTGPYGKTKAELEWPVMPPALDEFGYPLEGETVLADAEAGIWFYASPTLIVQIKRVFDAEKIVTWYEADVYCDRDQEHFGSVLFDPARPQRKHVQAAEIARKNQVVFAMNTDYYTYRLGRKTMIGMVIRDKTVFFDRVPEANRRQFPNLDTLAMYQDGSWGVYHSDELTAQQYLEDGAVDVFSFGPYLVRDGELNPFLKEMRNGKTDQPRCAIGMIEPGHYFAILAEGRIPRESVGVNIDFLAEHMLAAGCQQALNLDGGQTAVMCFMGDQITRIGKYAGGRTSARTTTEIMGIGRSSQIDPNKKK